MSRDKRIDSMTKDLCHVETCEIKKIGIPCNHRCKAHIYATRAINKGYAKASDVALEVLDIIKNKLLEYFNEEDKKYDASVTKSKKQFDIATARYRAISEVVKLIVVDISAELKKKYESEKDNG